VTERTRDPRSVHRAEKALEISSGTTMFPELVVHVHEAVPRNDAHRDLVRQLLRLEIRVVREHPHVAQLVGHCRIEFFIAQTFEESILDRKPEGLASIEWRFDSHDLRDLRLDRDIHILRYPELASKTIDDKLKTLGDESGRFSHGCGSNRTSEREEEEHIGRRQRDP
jgi:hypothetical protein